MMKRVHVLAILTVFAVVACTPGANEPAEPVWGKQGCAHCAMLVTEKPSSAQLTLVDGTRRFFDDVGCLVAHLDREKETPHSMWVRHGETWTPATEARFVSGVVTPMDFGFVAAADGVGWEEVKKSVREKTRAHEHGGHGVMQ